MPITGDAAFRKDEDLYLLLSGLFYKPLNRLEVRLLLAGPMLKLNRSNANVLHGILGGRGLGGSFTRVDVQGNVIDLIGGHRRGLGFVAADCGEGNESEQS